MSRSLTSGMVTEVTGSALTPIYLVKASFDSGNLNLWSGIGDLVWGADTYTGAGDLINIGDIQETNQMQALNVTFTLNGLNSSVISSAYNENYQQRPIYCWLGCLDSAGALIADPEPVFQGLMDVMIITEAGNTASIGVSCESRTIDINRIREIDYTSQAQRALYTGDTFCDFVAQLQDQQIYWGRPAPK